MSYNDEIDTDIVSKMEIECPMHFRILSFVGDISLWRMCVSITKKCSTVGNIETENKQGASWKTGRHNQTKRYNTGKCLCPFHHCNSNCYYDIVFILTYF